MCPYSVCTACCMFYCVGELFECICYLSMCGCCFVVEYVGVVLCLDRPFVAEPCMVLHSVCVFFMVPLFV